MVNTKQISREDFHDVAVFSVEKRNFFLQAQNCRTAVRLSGISKQPSRSGQGDDVLCRRKTDVAVVSDVTFPYKEPPSKSKRTVAEKKCQQGNMLVRSLGALST